MVGKKEKKYSKLFLNITVLALIQTIPNLICLKLSNNFLRSDKWLFKIRKWEKKGRVYQKIFKVKKWKHLVPDSGSILKCGFAKKKLKDTKVKYLKKFLVEINRAEWVHIMPILQSPLFLLWNKKKVAFLMMLNTILFNLPCIILQRYNRPRIMSVIKREEVALEDGMLHNEEEAYRDEYINQDEYVNLYVN